MAIERMDHVGITVDDMEAAIAYFEALGLELMGEGTVEGEEVDRILGLEGVRSDIAMLKLPGGDGRIELSKLHSPSVRSGDAGALVNTLGLRHLCFAVDDVEATLADAKAHGGELIGEVVEFGGYRSCYTRGPEGIIVEFAEEL